MLNLERIKVGIVDSFNCKQRILVKIGVVLIGNFSPLLE